MYAISTKYLREKLPLIRSELKKGTTFLVIHKSEPIAKLIPAGREIKDEQDWEEATEEEMQQAAADDINKELGKPSAEEIAYYKNLIKKNKR